MRERCVLVNKTPDDHDHRLEAKLGGGRGLDVGRSELGCGCSSRR